LEKFAVKVHTTGTNKSRWISEAITLSLLLLSKGDAMGLRYLTY